VILHEYGHAIQDAQVTDFGSSPEGGAIGEAFGDYWAVTVTDIVAHNGFDVPCVADWDSVSYTRGPSHCLRRVDTDKHYPKDIIGEVHADGEIWSRALWDIRNALGSTEADTIILESQFSFAPDTTFAQAAAVTVATAQKIGGNSAANAVTAAFVDPRHPLGLDARRAAGESRPSGRRPRSRRPGEVTTGADPGIL
jgi:Zn-dependent metalloprotease